MSPRLVLKVASQTDVAEMQVGGAFVNHTTRVVDPVEGGHVGTTAAVVNGWVVGVGNVVGGTVLDVEVATVVEGEVDVVVVVFLADFVPVKSAPPASSASTSASGRPQVTRPAPSLCSLRVVPSHSAHISEDRARTSRSE